MLPVVERLAAARRDVPVSIDTYKARVALEAVARGAVIVNDVSALQYDAGLAAAVAETGAALVVMHNRGRSREMYREATYQDVAGEMAGEVRAGMERAVQAGVRRESIIVDPGLGFAKRGEHSYTVLAELQRLRALDRPILCGPSRKSFLTLATGARPPAERDWATASAVAICVQLGAHIVRVHAVKEMVDVVRVADRIVASR